MGPFRQEKLRNGAIGLYDIASCSKSRPVAILPKSVRMMRKGRTRTKLTMEESVRSASLIYPESDSDEVASGQDYIHEYLSNLLAVECEDAEYLAAISPVPAEELDTPFDTPIDAPVVVSGFTLKKHKGMMMQGAVTQDLEPDSDYLFEPHL